MNKIKVDIKWKNETRIDSHYGKIPDKSCEVEINSYGYIINHKFQYNHFLNDGNWNGEMEVIYKKIIEEHLGYEIFDVENFDKTPAIHQLFILENKEKFMLMENDSFSVFKKMYSTDEKTTMTLKEDVLRKIIELKTDLSIDFDNSVLYNLYYNPSI